MPDISQARAANVARHPWTKLYTLKLWPQFLAFTSAFCAWALHEATATSIKLLVSPVNGWLFMVANQKWVAMHASTSVVFARGRWRCTIRQQPSIGFSHASRDQSLWNIWTHSFKICGIWPLANKYTHVHNAVLVVWGELRLAPTMLHIYA